MADAPNSPPQNIWQFLLICFQWLWEHGTRVLGVLIGTIGILAANDVIPERHLKFYLLAIAVLTYWRGQFNADAIAEKVIAKQAASQPESKT